MQESSILTDNQQANSVKLGWLIGMIEAEGSVIMAFNQSQNQIQAKISWCNTDIDIIEKFQAILQGLGIKYWVSQSKRSSAHLGKKPRTDIHIYRFASLKVLLPLIIPYMTGIKKRKAEIILQWVLSRMQAYRQLENGKMVSTQHLNKDRKYTPEQLDLFRKFQTLQ